MNGCSHCTFQHWPDFYKFNTNPRGVCVIIDCVGNDGGETFSTYIAVKLCLVKVKRVGSLHKRI